MICVYEFLFSSVLLLWGKNRHLKWLKTVCWGKYFYQRQWKGQKSTPHASLCVCVCVCVCRCVCVCVCVCVCIDVLEREREKFLKFKFHKICNSICGLLFYRCTCRVPVVHWIPPPNLTLKKTIHAGAMLLFYVLWKYERQRNAISLQSLIPYTIT